MLPDYSAAKLLRQLNGEKYLECDTFLIFQELMAKGHSEMFLSQQPLSKVAATRPK